MDFCQKLYFKGLLLLLFWGCLFVCFFLVTGATLKGKTETKMHYKIKLPTGVNTNQNKNPLKE